MTFNRFGLSPGGNGSGVGTTASNHSQRPGFYQLSGFRKGYVFLNADSLNLLSFCQTGQSLADEAWGRMQIEQSLGPSHRPSCLSFPQPGHFSATLQRWLVWPNLLQLKQRIGFGTNKAAFTVRHPTVISFGISGVMKIRNKALVGTFQYPFSPSLCGP